MNKLEEYKIDKGDKYRQVWEDGGARPEIHQGFEDGFDAAIALDLPVKFYKWANTFPVEINGIDFNHYDNLLNQDDGPNWTEQQLYKYWLDNIYKPE